ncbi:MAG: lantibiotic dehydratase [Chitinophagaceae bacterium]
MANPFVFTETLVFRSPAKSFPESIPADIIPQLLNDQFFLEAIYIASPVLFKQVVKLKNGAIVDAGAIQKLHISIMKYYQRMYSRCTPFGLFAGCGVTKWASPDSESDSTQERGTYRQTRLDMYYLCKLSFHLSTIDCIRKKIRWYPNSSLYKMAGHYRYIEYEYVNDKRSYKIAEATHTAGLEIALKIPESGLLIAELVALLTNSGYAIDESENFISQLIDSQLLLSELEPAVTGEDPLKYIIALLKRIAAGEVEIEKIVGVLEEVSCLLTRLDQAKDTITEYYDDIIKWLVLLGVSCDETKLFQVDMFHQATKRKVPFLWQEQLMQSFSFLSGINRVVVNKNLENFIKKFKDRYDERWMPFNEVLDPDAGIGYADEITNSYSDLVDGLALPVVKPGNTMLPWNAHESWLFGKLLKASLNKNYQVTISDEEIKRFTADWDSLPPSMSIMFSSINDDTIVLDGISGSSAANLLGRFSSGMPAIGKLVNHITAAEQTNYPEVIFAEILHVPEDRTGNILLRPQSREFEIPFLARASGNDPGNANTSNRMILDDLLLSVRNGKVVMVSKKNAMQVIPKLGTAHNFSLSALPVYRFLCDLQGQHLRSGLRFSWGHLQQQFNFLPRVVLQHVILSEATWHFKKEEFQELLVTDDTLRSKVHSFFNTWRLPNLVVLVDGDNELLVDISNALSIQAFVKAIWKRPSIILKEYLKPEGSVPSEGNYATQYIAPVIQNRSDTGSGKPPDSPLIFNAGINCNRSFVPGSEWIYAKIYCSEGIAERILNDSIKPMLAELNDRGCVDKWFFIRYNDTGHHLRLRIKINSPQQVSDALALCDEYFAVMHQTGLARTIEYATYDRELERYGVASMELSESVFHHNSIAILRFLSAMPADRERWLWGIYYADLLLNAFGYDLAAKSRLLQHVSESFLKEFKAGKLLYLQINTKYRDAKKDIFEMLGQQSAVGQPVTPFGDEAESFKSIKTQFEQLNLAAGFVPQTTTLLSSYLHMHFNRLFPAQQRIHEMVMYSFMHQYYQSKMAMAKVKSS